MTTPEVTPVEKPVAKKKPIVHGPFNHNDQRTNHEDLQSPADFAAFYRWIYARQPGLVVRFNNERHGVK